MTTLRNPIVTSTLSAAFQKAGFNPQKILVVAQKVAAGTAVSGALNENILNDNSWETLAGENSQGAAAVRAIKKLNGVTQVDAIFLDDAAGTPAAGVFTITGPATEAGSLTFNVGSSINGSYTIGVADADTATTIGDALAAAITADTKSLVTAVNVAGVVTLTATNDGTVGNTIGLGVVGSVGGVAVAITAMTGGATDPTLTGVFDVVGNTRYQTIVWPYDVLTELKAFLDPRFNVDNNILDGVGIYSKTDTFANLKTLIEAENSESLSIIVDRLENETDYKGPAVFELPMLKAAQFAAIRALRLTEDANIANFVIARTPGDTIGGQKMAAKPYFNTPFPNLPLVKTGLGFLDDTEINQLQDAGGWVIGNNRAGNEVIAGQVVTTYKNDSAGNPDNTFSFLNYVDCSSGYREYMVNNVRAKYAQYRLTGGALVGDGDIANEESIKSFVVELNNDLGEDFQIAQVGVGTVDGVKVDYDKAFKDGLSVSIDLAEGKTTIAMTAYIVVQARIFLIPIQISFSPEG